jgi:hypothetical protein
MAMAGFADALFAGFIAALVGCRRQPRQPTDLAAILKVAPGKELHDIQPGAVVADAAQAQELPDVLHVRVVGRVQLLAALGLQFGDMLIGELPTGPLAFQTGAQTGRHGRAIP